jgi:hypothetical protein
MKLKDALIEACVQSHVPTTTFVVILDKLLARGVDLNKQVSYEYVERAFHRWAL